MSENYYYSSLSGQEIEDTLVGAVRFNAMQGLTTSQKAQARQNIGAGEENTQIKIKGFYDTLEDLQQHIPVGTEGDVYAVGTASPYDLYIWDAVNIRWVNNGPISFSDAIIDDNDVSTSSAWSSAKVTNELAAQKAEIESDIDAVSESLATYIRPNLLDNAYFAGGGSQQGGGQFPINQRGQTVYTGEGYCIDRWRANGSFTLASDGISIGSDVVLCQLISNVNALVGKQLSFSVLTADELITASFVFSIQTINYAVTDDFAIGYNTSLGGFTIYARNADAIKILSAKLELGSEQTLAHQENGVWVLNEIPDYTAELTKCQRYLRVTGYGANFTAVFGVGASTTQINAFFPFPNMVGSVNISPDGGSNWKCAKYDGTAISLSKIEPFFTSHSEVGVKFTGTGITANATYIIYTGSSTKVIFSAEL